MKQRVDVDAIASRNPAIDASRFKIWRRKMARIERLGLDAEAQPSAPPPTSPPAVPNGRGLFSMGNRQGQASRAANRG